MAPFDVIASTVRAGLSVDEVAFDVPNAAPATAYLLGRQPHRTQSVVIALHDERGDKSTLLPELEILASRGFLCLAIDSPASRLSFTDRNPGAAFAHQYASASAAIDLLSADVRSSHRRVAVLGRSLGGEVAGALAQTHDHVNVVVAIDPMLNRCQFVTESDHPIAAGIRQFHTPAALATIIDQLNDSQLQTLFEKVDSTHWLVQLSADDDRLDDHDWSYLATDAPPTVRVDRHETRRKLISERARRTRVDFINQLCG